MSNTVIDIKGLTKKIGDQTIVDAVNLEIQKGECFGILGPPGAGKTSLLKMLYCSSSANFGEMYVLGMSAKVNFREVKSRMGVVIQEENLELDFTVSENLQIFADYFRIDKKTSERRCLELIRMFSLDSHKDRLAADLPSALRKRLAFARAMVNNPEILILDEPTWGLDPKARAWFRNFLAQKKRELGTVVVTTQFKDEAELLFDRIAVMDKGQILSVGTPQELMLEHVGGEVVEFEASNADMSYYVGRVKGASYPYSVVGNRICVFVQPNQDSRRVLDLVSSPRLTLRKPNLNDVFLKLSGHDLREDLL